MKYTIDISSILDVKQNPNYSITNKQWFKESELAQQILSETSWVDKLNPELSYNQRILLIRDNITEFKICPICGSQVAFRNKISDTSDYCSRSCANKSTAPIRIASKKQNSQDKRCVSLKLLKYPLACYDYKLKNNRPYNQGMRGRLLANYIWFEYRNLDLVTKCLLKYSKQRIFNIIRNDLSFLIPEFEREYQLDFNSSDRHRILKFEKEPRICPHCGNRVLNNNTFCSVPCANNHKTTDKTYLRNLSQGVSNWYKNADEDEVKDRHIKIKNSITILNSNLSVEERKEKYSNIELVYNSFDNRAQQFSHLTFLFDKDFYYSNKYLPVRCNTCGFKWEMTKSTNIGRIVCIKCNPYKKGKTQADIFDFIQSITECKMNDKSFLKDKKEIDILCIDHRLAVEYDGLLYHSYGISKYPLFHKPVVDANYHLRKTEECEAKGFQLFHIFENEWTNPIKNNIWRSLIEYKLGIKKDFSSYIIKEVEKEISDKFLNNNHLEGSSLESDISIGLYSKDELISVMEFKIISHNNYEITRWCSNLCEELESRLLRYFEDKYLPDSIIYYCNRRYEDQAKFVNVGFEFMEHIPPRCFKFKVNENILHHCDYTNYKLIDSERIIFDCGQTKFIKIY